MTAKMKAELDFLDAYRDAGCLDVIANIISERSRRLGQRISCVILNDDFRVATCVEVYNLGIDVPVQGIYVDYVRVAFREMNKQGVFYVLLDSEGQTIDIAYL